ncbi:MAG: type III-B CRISPR module-associated protein Cmr5 [Ardenticatenales bacterium]|nr:type III-B CRISPR module-associated protein Cmr5 [Ardenticatenales bacterium]
MATFKTRSQVYATKVLAKVEAIESNTNQGDKLRSQYGSMSHKLPVLIRTAGLAQAISFVAARGQQGAKTLLDDLSVVVGQEDGDKLQKKVLEAKLPEYMRLTQEALYALLWFKRFAQSVLDVDASVDAGDDDS